METRKALGLIGFLFLLIALPLALFVVRQQVQYRGRAVNPPALPQNIRITNVHDKGFTLSWITDQDTTGAVLFYGTNQSGTTPIAIRPDVRGNTTVSRTHYVDVFDSGQAGLEPQISPGTKYFFRIQSGEGTGSIFGKLPSDGEDQQFDHVVADGANFSKTTAPLISYDPSATVPDSPTNTPGAYSLEPGAFAKCNQNDATKSACFRPNPVWGQIIKCGGAAAPGAIVYMKLSGTTHTLSTITQSGDFAGKWVMDLANFRTSGLDRYASYLPFNEQGPDTLSFEVQGAADGMQVLAGVGIPEVIANSCANLTDPTQCLEPPLYPGGAYGWDVTDPNNQYIKILLPCGPTITPTVTPTTTVVPTITPTPTSPPSQTTLTIKINFQNIPNPSGTRTLSNLTVKRGGTVYKNVDNLMVTAGTGYFQAQTALDGSPPTASDYMVCIKGQQHLRKTFTGVTINAGQDNVSDQSTNKLIDGDVNNDNVINSDDVTALIAKWTQFSVPVSGDPTLKIFDLNEDGYINSDDATEIIRNWISFVVNGDGC